MPPKKRPAAKPKTSMRRPKPKQASPAAPAKTGEEALPPVDETAVLEVMRLKVAGHGEPEALRRWIEQNHAGQDPEAIIRQASRRFQSVATASPTEQIGFCIQACREIYSDLVKQKKTHQALRVLQEIARLSVLYRPDVPDPREPLTDKQRRFAEEYIVDHNGTQAAKRAGYKGNAVTLASVAYELLRKPQIQRLVAWLQYQQTAGTVTTAEERREILSKIERGTLRKIARTTDLAAWLELHPEALDDPSISEIEVENTEHGPRVKKVKLRDPTTAIREHNLMDGDHAPTDINLRGTYVDPYDEMTPEQLAAEAKRLDTLDTQHRKAKAKASPGKAAGKK